MQVFAFVGVFGGDGEFEFCAAGGGGEEFDIAEGGFVEAYVGGVA